MSVSEYWPCILAGNHWESENHCVCRGIRNSEGRERGLHYISEHLLNRIQSFGEIRVESRLFRVIERLDTHPLPQRAAVKEHARPSWL